jgi:hypothetical protein
VITDATPRPPPGKFTRLELQHATGTVELGWEGQGRVFQIERALQPSGSWLPASPIISDRTFNDPGVLLQQPQGFYRLEQW